MPITKAHNHRFENRAHLHDSRSISRRQLLRAGALAIPAGFTLPAWLTAEAQSAGVFDFYVSPTGSDSNPGTLSQPWAITSLSLFPANTYNVANCKATSGKRVGFLPGTYYLSTAFRGSINSGSNQMTVSGITGAITVGMYLVSGLGGAYTIGPLPASRGWGPQITAISGNVITLSESATATLTTSMIVATLMSQDPTSGAIQIIGSGSSTSPTYWGSSNSSGNYSPRTATLDAEGGSGIPSGFITTSVNGESGPIIAHTGKVYPTSYTVSNAIIDGLRLTGYSYYGIRVGAYSEADGPSGITGVTIQNCEIFGGNASVGGFADNIQAIWIDSTSGTLVTNNWIHDNVGWQIGSMNHLTAIIVYGSDSNSPSYVTTGTVIQYNTCINAGGVYGKDKYLAGNTVQYNYIDVSGLVNACAVLDWSGGNANGLSGTTVFRGNIIIMSGGASAAFGSFTYSGSQIGYTTPIQVYNNTVVITSGGVPTIVWLYGSGSANGAIQFYNNIYVNNSSSGGSNGPGAFTTNPAAPGIWDYNLSYSPNVSSTWSLHQNSNFGVTIGNYATASAFASALTSNGGISGAEAHSLSSAPTFMGTGDYAAQYQLKSGSIGKGSGSTTGTTSGLPCDMGAWGGAAPPNQIGCSFTSGTSAASPVPNAPVLSVG